MRSLVSLKLYTTFKALAGSPLNFQVPKYTPLGSIRRLRVKDR